MSGAKTKTELEWRCAECLEAHRTAAAAPATGPWPCRKCGREGPAHPEALDEAGRLAACPACGCRDLYRQRDFNRKLGIAIVVAGAALSPWTMYLSIVACVLIDVAIYRATPECVVCYHCHAIMRGYPGMESIPAFDLNTSDKYIDVERKRGW